MILTLNLIVLVPKSCLQPHFLCAPCWTPYIDKSCRFLENHIINSKIVFLFELRSNHIINSKSYLTVYITLLRFFLKKFMVILIHIKCFRCHASETAQLLVFEAQIFCPSDLFSLTKGTTSNWRLK